MAERNFSGTLELQMPGNSSGSGIPLRTAISAANLINLLCDSGLMVLETRSGARAIGAARHTDDGMPIGGEHCARGAVLRQAGFRNPHNR